MTDRKTQDQDKFIVRLPDGMRDRLKELAESHHRSMNAEIVLALTLWVEKSDLERAIETEYHSLSGPPGPQPGDMVDGEVVPEPNINIVNTPAEVDAVVERITRETAARLRAEMLKMLRSDK